MPLVLTQKLSGTAYADRIGESYQFPSRYLRLLEIHPGDDFVYYRPIERDDGGYYFGAGAIASIHLATKESELATLTLRNYKKFPRPVPRKDDALGHYAETNGTDRPFFQWSLRMIDPQDFARLLAAGLLGSV